MSPTDDTPSLWQFVPVATSIAGAGLSLYGASTAAKGSIAAGNASNDAAMRAAAAYRDAGNRQAASELIKARRAKEADDFAAAQYTQNAGEIIAASQRAANDETRQAKLVQSRAVALAAASGAGASDVSVVNLVSRIRGEGSYRAQTQLYQGESQARQMRMAAKAKSYEGLTAEEAGSLNAADVTAKYEAAATSEEAKGVAAQAAGRVGAATARIKGLQGALPAIGAIGTAASGIGSLYDKYWKTSASDSGDAVSTGGEVDPNILRAQMAGTQTNVIADNQAIYDADYAQASTGMPYADASVIEPIGGATTDFSWLSLLE